MGYLHAQVRGFGGLSRHLEKTEESFGKGVRSRRPNRVKAVGGAHGGEAGCGGKLVNTRDALRVYFPARVIMHTLTICPQNFDL